LTNGTAIKGVCVTRRPSGHLSRYFRQKTVTVGKEGMLCPDEQSETGARVFAVQAVNIVEHYECRGTKQVASRVFVTIQDANFWHWCSVAVQVFNGALNLSRCRTMIAGRCGCPGISALQSCHECRRKSKNRDNFPLHGTTCPVQREVVPRSGKQITFIVRVSVCNFYYQFTMQSQTYFFFPLWNVIENLSCAKVLLVL
jgi:hypothetical protein